MALAERALPGLYQVPYRVEGTLADATYRQKLFDLPERAVRLAVPHELEEIAYEQGTTLEPGDALLVYSGREAFARDNGGVWAGRPSWPGRWAGLHASCLPFIRDNDVAVLGWDMMDAGPADYGLSFSVHGALFYYGVALVDNALLEPLAGACAEEGRHEFMLMIGPLVVIGGTGSPVNPIAMF